MKEERKVCDLPREVLWTMNPKRFKTTIVPSVEKGLPQEVSCDHSSEETSVMEVERRVECWYSVFGYTQYSK